MFRYCLTKQCRDVIGGLIEYKVELSISLVHLISFQKTETGSTQQMVLSKPRAEHVYDHDTTEICLNQQIEQTFLPHLIIHDDFVGHCIEQGGLRDELFLGIFVFLFTCLLNIVSCQCV